MNSQQNCRNMVRSEVDERTIWEKDFAVWKSETEKRLKDKDTLIDGLKERDNRVQK